MVQELLDWEKEQALELTIFNKHLLGVIEPQAHSPHPLLPQAGLLLRASPRDPFLQFKDFRDRLEAGSWMLLRYR